MFWPRMDIRAVIRALSGTSASPESFMSKVMLIPPLRATLPVPSICVVLAVFRFALAFCSSSTGVGVAGVAACPQASRRPATARTAASRRRIGPGLWGRRQGLRPQRRVSWLERGDCAALHSYYFGRVLLTTADRSACAGRGLGDDH